MNKFTFKMKDRMKLVVERPATNSCTFTVSGKKDTTFRFSKKRAAELVNSLSSTITYGTSSPFLFKKTLKSPAGSIVVVLTQPTTMVDAYELLVKEGNLIIFVENGISKKQVKKMIKTIKEVYGVE